MNGFDHYKEIRKNFQWNGPDNFNFGRDVVDRYASDRSKVAFFYEDAGGVAAKYTFWEVSRISGRFGNVLQGLGVKAGDPVLLLLQNVPEWYFCMAAGTKIGAVMIPCSDQLRGEIVKAYVVLRKGYEASDALKKELQDHVKKVTAPYKYPRDIVFAKELPKTSSGKIRRVELRNAEWKRS